jgi:hypothetical protein
VGCCGYGPRLQLPGLHAAAGLQGVQQVTSGMEQHMLHACHGSGQLLPWICSLLFRRECCKHRALMQSNRLSVHSAKGSISVAVCWGMSS